MLDALDIWRWLSPGPGCTVLYSSPSKPFTESVENMSCALRLCLSPPHRIDAS